jgi:glycosyltransferase involved in cell wall biosynthesis
MNIAHVISSSGMFGAEQVLLTLAEQFNRESDHAFVCPIIDKRMERSPILDVLKKRGLPHHVLSSKGRFDFKTVSELQQFIVEKKIDILHTHNYKSDMIGMLAARKFKTPLIATAHGFTDMTNRVTFYEKFDRFILKTYFDQVVTVTESVMEEWNSPKKKIIANGIDIKRFSTDPLKRSAFRKEWNVGEHDIAIGTIGRLSKEKNQEMLLQAASILCPQNRHLRFFIIGAGPEEKRLKQLTHEYNVSDRVVFTGLIEDVAPVYQGLDMFTLTSTTEGIPMTILEAFASHVPVVATKVGGMSQLITSETGLLVESNHVNDLVKKLEKLIKDKKLGLQYAEQAFHFVQAHYSDEIMIKRYRNVYEEALKK